VFYARQDSKATEPDTFAIRVKNVSASAAQTAAQGISTAATSAATGVSKGVQQGVYSVRVWTAPRLESAADHTTKTVAPKVSSALRTSAQQIRPLDMQKKSRSVLTWSILAAAVLATAGAVAALVKYRYRAEMTTDDEEDFAAGPSGTAATGTEGAAPADSTATGADAGVDGRVSTPGW
jgi:hypothetical protein